MAGRRDSIRVSRQKENGLRRRALLLLVTLVILAVFALLGASFAFWMRADLASVEAIENQLQARLAAESGIQRVMLLLRNDRFNMDNWYNNYKSLRRIPVFLEGNEDADLESLADQELEPGTRAWRFSIVNYERIGEDDAEIRYGLTDEASKVNINIASREQLLKLFDQFELENITSPELADAIIDWRDENDTPNSFFGAESNYYFGLNPPYRAKNKYFESVEELLMLKGFNANGQILYGEDYNRNGYLDENEDDGPEGVFPPDDGDGVLDQGIYSLVTVYSWDWNSSNDNKPRININAVKFTSSTDPPTGDENAPPTGGNEDQEPPTGEEGEEEDQLAGLKDALKGMGGAGGIPDYIYDEVRPEVIDFIAEAQKRGFKFRSVGELLGLEVFEDGSSNYDRMWRNYFRQRRRGENERKTEFEEEDVPPGDLPPDEESEDNAPDDETPEDGAPDEDDLDDRDPDGDADGERDNDRDGRDDRRNGDRDGGRDEGNFEDDRRNGGREDDRFDPNEEEDKRDARRRQSVRNEDNEESGNVPEEVNGDPILDEDEEEEGELSDEEQQKRGTPIISPVTEEDMAVLIDRFTAIDAPAIPGQINVNTASARALRTVPGLTEDEVSSIISTRGQLNAEEKFTTAWLVSRQALAPEKYALVSNGLTTRSIQFTIDAIGFADHVGTFKRIQAVVEMRGQIAQLKYYRDISNLGIGYPVRDDERSEGFAFTH